MTEDTRCREPCLRDLGDQQHISTLNGRVYFKVLGCPIGVSLRRKFSFDTEIKNPLSQSVTYFKQYSVSRWERQLGGAQRGGA